MAAVSQRLVDFANHRRQQPAPGIEVIVTPRYQVTLQADFPIPGPNSVAWIRCRPDEADDVIREARAAIAPRHLPVMWTLDPETAPADFADHLAAHDVLPDQRAPRVEVMLVPIDARIESPTVAGLEIHDALADPATFRQADAVSAEAFGSRILGGDDPELMESLERRRRNQIAAGDRHVLLATVDGEPAGTGALTLAPPFAGMINGGAVRPKFRGRGVYLALVAARMEIARRAGVDGLVVWGAPSSAPILARRGFQTVGWREFYPDTSTA